MDNSYLIKKYNVPVPRYTSYPAIPLWDPRTFSVENWKKDISRNFSRENGRMSLYMHMPFCESLCTYCGCNKRITVNHDVEKPYIEALLKEWDMYKALFNGRPQLNELHLGGGTPSFFSAENLHYLLSHILADADTPAVHEYSIEVHPNYMRPGQLEILSELGFNRLSMGVQDFDPRVQKAIHRIQTVAQTSRCNEASRANGLSVNMDIIYGLPFQTLEAVKHTVEEVIKMRPERIAFYSYAHVPWKSAGQRAYSEKDLPAPELKRRLYETGCQMLLDAGYEAIGMDHFSLPDDHLLAALKSGKLARNFMGYTDNNDRLQLALGVSAIADTYSMFAQNVKTVEDYEAIVDKGELPILKGHQLTETQQFIRKHIQNLMCNYCTYWESEEDGLFEKLLPRLDGIKADGLVETGKGYIRVNEKGKPFIRNVCAAIDPMLKNIDHEKMFSKSV